jgi:hypothetical protein
MMRLRDCSTIATVYLIAVSNAISYTSNVQLVFLTPWFGAITASPYILASAVFAAFLHSAGGGYWLSDSPSLIRIKNSEVSNCSLGTSQVNYLDFR